MCRKGFHGLAIALAGVCVLLAPASRAAPGVTRLTGSTELARAYDTILDARFDEAAAEIAKACPPAPKEACQLLAAAAERWRIELDFDDRSRDAKVSAQVEAAIASAEAWTRREPTRAEPWFYLGAAYGMRAQLHGMRLERLAAARDGKRIKTALERALAIDPQLVDANFGIGVYRYLAGVVPAPVKLLLWLLMLPGGDRERGLQQMLAAREQGELLRGEADFQLHWFYLWYEGQPERALELLEGLRSRFPHNPLFVWRIAEVQDVYFHDRAASRDTYQSLVDAAAAGNVAMAPLASVRGRLGLAEQLDELYESDRAIALLNDVIAERPSAPYGALARAHYLLGVAQDRLGRHEVAVTAYQAARAAVPRDDPAGLQALVRERLSRPPDPNLARAYRLSLEGWRAVERGALAQAEAPLMSAVASAPADPVIRYRVGRFFLAKHDPDRALAEFERVLAARPLAPPSFLAAAYADAAQILEARGERARAIEMYRVAARTRGAEPATRNAARAALARLGAR